MKFNKTLAKTLVFALAISFAPSFGTTVKAAAPTVNFSAVDQEVSSNADFYWGTVKKLKKEKGSNLKIGSDFYKVENIEKVIGKKLNLSNMKFNKDTLLAFGSSATLSETDWVVKTFPAEEKTLKVYYGMSKDFGKFTGKSNTFGNAEVGFIGASTGKKDLTEVNLTTLQVHNGNGVWADFATYFGSADDAGVGTKLKGLIQTGANLYFRKKGDANTLSVNSKDFKLKIPAQASAPKVTVKDGKTGLKKGLEYIVKETGTDMGTTWTPVADANTVKYTDTIFANKTKSYDFYVRNAAKGKKGPSKYTKLLISHETAPEVPESTDKTTIIKADGVASLIKDSAVGISTKVSYDITKGAEITNASSNNYEIYVSYDGNTPASDAKWITLKAAKDPSKPTKVSIKYSATGKANTYAGNKSSKLYVRIPAKKQKANSVILASAALDFNLNLENIAQTAEFEAEQDAPVAVDNAKKYKATLHSVAPAELKVYTFKIAATKLVKTGAKPKVKIDKMDGVKVTIGAFGEDMKAEIKVELSNKAFPTAGDITGDKVLNIIMNYEGIKDKAFEIHFSKEAKS